MIEAGDVHLADLQGDRRHTVLVVSTSRFHDLSGRVLVAPSVALPPLDDELPWRIVVDGRVFAVDLLRSVPTDRLLDRVGRAPTSAVFAARRALRAIT